MRVHSLLKLGVGLREQGVLTEEGEIPGPLADWLVEIEGAYADVAEEQESERRR